MAGAQFKQNPDEFVKPNGVKPSRRWGIVKRVIAPLTDS
jgi:hypothetical protein